MNNINNENYESNDENCENCENIEKDSGVNKENKEKFIINYRRVTVWPRNKNMYGRFHGTASLDFNNLDEALQFIKNDEKLKENFTLECVTYRI